MYWGTGVGEMTLRRWIELRGNNRKVSYIFRWIVKKMIFRIGADNKIGYLLVKFGSKVRFSSKIAATVFVT